MPENIEKGLIYKSAEVEVQDVDEEELKRINKYTLAHEYTEG